MSDEFFDRTIVIVGKTGNGKSATGNTFLGRRHFISKRGADSVTQTIDVAMCNRVVNNSHLHLTVIDTPGLFDCKNVAQRALEIMKIVKLRPHIFFFVLSDGRFTDEEKYTVALMKIIFGADVVKHMIVVVTHSNNFQNDVDFQEFLDNEHVNQLVESCGNRVLTIENSTQTFSFVEFRRLMNVLHSEYVNQHFEIHKSVIEKYFREYHGDKHFALQLEEMNKELALRIPNWKDNLIALGVLGAGSALIAGCVFIAKTLR